MNKIDSKICKPRSNILYIYINYTFLRKIRNCDSVFMLFKISAFLCFIFFTVLIFDPPGKSKITTVNETKAKKTAYISDRLLWCLDYECLLTHVRQLFSLDLLKPVMLFEHNQHHPTLTRPQLKKVVLQLF